MESMVLSLASSPLNAMTRNIKMTLCYDGTSYLGWQKTKEGPSIEEALEKVFEKILQQKTSFQAASRTDAGVHAEGQIVNFHLKSNSICLKKLLQSANKLLPSDILIEKIEEESPFFHPTLDSRSKEYHYRVSTSFFLSPFKTRTHWHFPYILDETLMKNGALDLIGKKDFKAFTNHKKNSHKDTIREVFSIEIVKEGLDFLFIIKGDHFLYKMVRNIVGTLCYIGCHKLPYDCIESLLSQKLRMKAGVTAPACGLVLKSIVYS